MTTSLSLTGATSFIDGQMGVSSGVEPNVLVTWGSITGTVFFTRTETAKIAIDSGVLTITSLFLPPFDAMMGAAAAAIPIHRRERRDRRELRGGPGESL